MINTILQGDALELAKSLPDNSIHCIVTSPPYWGLRDYGTALWQGGNGECDHVEKEGGNLKNSPYSTRGGANKIENAQNLSYKIICKKCGATRIDAQMGLEETPEQYIENMVVLFRELRRVLRKDGTLWLNMGDSYASGEIGRHDQKSGEYLTGGNSQKGKGEKRQQAKINTGLKPKDLCGIPWKLAIALQNDGWYLRSDIIWSKPNPMPESVTDRPTKAHEYLFLLTKSPRYFYDANAIREPVKEWTGQAATFARNGDVSKHIIPNQLAAVHRSDRTDTIDTSNGRNRRSVWEIATQPYPEAHFATFPEALIEPCILAGTSAYGCCNICGNPFERIIEKVFKGDGNPNSYEDRLTKGSKMKLSGLQLAEWKSNNPDKFIGWQPTCKCPNNTPMPAIVLDPFFGSGTTGSVAKRLGRYYLGFELNPDYIKLATKRINNTQPPLFVLT